MLIDGLKYAYRINISVLCFTARSNNEGFENPFPDGLVSESFNVYVLARAYDRSGAYAEEFCQVIVCSTLNKNLKTENEIHDFATRMVLYNLS